MNDEPSNVEVARLDQSVERLPYHPPKLVSLGRMQTLVQSSINPGHDGNPGVDGASSAT